MTRNKLKLLYINSPMLYKTPAPGTHAMWSVTGVVSMYGCAVAGQVAS